MYGYEELARYSSGDIRSNDSLLGLFFYIARNTDKIILAHEARIKELEAENERLKVELEHSRSYKRTIKMRSRNLQAENERLKRHNDELVRYNGIIDKYNDELEKENAKLKCLVLHLFKHLAYHECKDWGRIRDGLAESKLKKRCVRNTDRWWRIATRCNDAYRKAKKKLMEGSNAKQLIV